MSRVGFQEKLDPPLNISLDKFLHTIMRHDLNVYKEYLYVFLRLKTWDFATMLKLRGMIGTWEPMWTSLKFS